MANVLYVLLNGPVSVVCLLITLFFCSCLILTKRAHEEGLKQPLLLLLWSLVGWNGCLQLTIFLSITGDFLEVTMQHEIWLLMSFILQLSILSSLSASTWMSIFYFSHIVPAQCVFFVWVKRNIKIIIYCGLAIDMGSHLAIFILRAREIFQTIAMKTFITGHNSSFPSAHANYSEARTFNKELFYTGYLVFQIFGFITHLTAAMSSSCSTVLYLQKHMKRMQMSLNSSFSSPHLQSQWRVTITGIIHLGLYLACSLWLFLQNVLQNIDFDSKDHILCTGFCLFSFGTIINLGVGQTVFRQPVTILWKRAVQIFMLCQFNRK